MIKISIIGFGNVGRHLADAFEDGVDTELVQVFSRSGNSGSLPYSDRIVTKSEELKPADLYIISVSDRAVAEVSENLPFSDRLVVHTAGSLAIDVLDGRNRRGVFYPLQTFSKDKAVNFSKVPICIEAQSSEDFQLLQTVAKTLAEQVFPIDSEQRSALHVSAVFVSNFVNHLYKVGSDICEEHQMPFDILKPLIAETADKIVTLSPRQAQTGPAIRGDRNTMDAHLSLLSDTNQKKIYELLSSSIKNER